MKIIDIAVKKVYRFNCPNCQSRLEADSKEVVDILSTFKNGAKAFETAEYETLESLDLFTN